MNRKEKSSSKILSITCEILLVFFLLWVASKALTNNLSQVTHAETSTAEIANNTEMSSGLLPVQGTTLVAVINDAIQSSDQSYTGQRHLRTNIRGDKRCFASGNVGKRYYDEVVFLNTSSTAQKVTIGFTSSCGNNTFMAAYTNQFDPTNICKNFIASSGLSGNTVWEFSVCANSQFSVVVYGVEPNVLCQRYSYSVYGVGIKSLSPGNGFLVENSAAENNLFAASSETLSDFPAYDVEIRRRKPKENRDTRRQMVIPDSLLSESLISEQGTPIAATVSDSISDFEPSFTGRSHFRSGLRGDPNCSPTGNYGTFHYDEVTFVNRSPVAQKVSVDFTSLCGNSVYAAAYSPQFNRFDICDGYIAGAGVSGSTVWDFSVCGNSQFTIVVYETFPDYGCNGYTYKLYGEGIAVNANISIFKAVTNSSISVGSNLNYMLNVFNSSMLGLNNVTLTDTLPSGTTFVSLNLITEFGTVLPASTCTTPPVGQAGTVSCLLDLLPAHPSGLPSKLTLALTTRLVSAKSPQISNTASVSFPGIDPVPNNNSSTATVSLNNPFDICLQDDSGRNYLKFNSSTGAYEFKDCASGFILTGTGTVTRRGNSITLQHITSDRRVQVQVDTGTKKAQATIQALSLSINFSISDTNITNNTCSCGS